MSILSPHLHNIIGKGQSWLDPAGAALDRNDPLAGGVQSVLLKKPPAPAPLAPPTQDTAADAQLQQQATMLRRRGILGNIQGGATGGTPTTTSKSTLGT